jgi:hypothetical protein
MKIIKLPLILSLILALSSCEDLIEKDLSKKVLTVNSPADNTVSAMFTQTFWWEEIKGADKYQIQIVKPSFASVQQFIMDTLIRGSRVELILSPGTYQWRIRAKNSTSSTEYITRNLTIDSTLDLSGQPLSLSLPANNHYSKTFSNNFSWQPMPNAENYVFQLLQSGSLVYTQSGSSTTCTYTVAAQGEYQWRVFAQNSTSNSSYATRTLTVDTAKPAIPTVIFPIADTSSIEPLPLEWNNTETGLSYHLQISADSNFTALHTDITISTTTYDVINLPSGQYYYWRVKAIDKALNESAYFSGRKIKKN